MSCSRSGRPVTKTNSLHWYRPTGVRRVRGNMVRRLRIHSLGPAEHPDVLCLCAYELRTGRRIQLWEDQLGPAPPYRMDDRALFVCFAATAECGCHLCKGLAAAEQGARSLPDVSLLHQRPQAAAGRQGPGRSLEPFRSRYGRREIQGGDAQTHPARPPFQPGGDRARSSNTA